MPNKNHDFHPKSFIAKHGGGTISRYRAGQTVYAQGDSADALFYIIRGTVRIVITSEFGKEAVVALLGGCDFFGEGCLDKHPERRSTLVVERDSQIARFDLALVNRALRTDANFSRLLMFFMVGRSERLKERLVTFIHHSSEERLAQLLLTLASDLSGAIPSDQNTLAMMVGTTRGRVNLFMNKFRKLGYIDYDGDIQVHPSLANIIQKNNHSRRISRQCF
jgi:CRP/FNR family transcriptional regulator, cyclic AMP receptor protein